MAHMRGMQSACESSLELVHFTGASSIFVSGLQLAAASVTWSVKSLKFFRLFLLVGLIWLLVPRVKSSYAEVIVKL